MNWLSNLLYGSTNAEFESSFGLEESIERLKKATSRSVFSAFTRQRAIGSVKETRVSLQRVIPFIGNSWKPFFLGRFEIRNGRVILVGRFTTFKFVKIFMSLWLGLCLFSVFVETAIMITQHLQWWLPLIGVGMFCCGIALVWIGKWFGRNDAAWLTAVINSALLLQ